MPQRKRRQYRRGEFINHGAIGISTNRLATNHQLVETSHREQPQAQHQQYQSCAKIFPPHRGQYEGVLASINVQNITRDQLQQTYQCIVAYIGSGLHLVNYP